MSTRSACPKGFTMVEVVIASAVAIVLLAAVHSTVTAMSRSAKSIRKNSEQRANMQRFLEILRRDLQGWAVAENETPRNATTASIDEKASKALLNFTTTADGLTQTSESSRRRTSSVTYSLRSSPEGTEVLRSEGVQSQAGEIVVYKERRAVIIEFLKDNKWVAEWTGKEKPACLRVRCGSEEQYLAMH